MSKHAYDDALKACPITQTLMDMLALAFRNPLDARKAKKLRDMLKLEDGAAMVPKESSHGATATTAAAVSVASRILAMEQHGGSSRCWERRHRAGV